MQPSPFPKFKAGDPALLSQAVVHENWVLGLPGKFCESGESEMGSIGYKYLFWL